VTERCRAPRGDAGVGTAPSTSVARRMARFACCSCRAFTARWKVRRWASAKRSGWHVPSRASVSAEARPPRRPQSARRRTIAPFFRSTQGRSVLRWARERVTSSPGTERRAAEPKPARRLRPCAAAIRASDSSRSIVAGPTARSLARGPSPGASCPCRSSAGGSTGIIGISRFEHTRSDASHRTTSASLTAARAPLLGRNPEQADRMPAMQARQRDEPAPDRTLRGLPGQPGAVAAR
jgi:hypothetical protein